MAKARPPPGRAMGPCGCSLSRLELFFHCKKDNFMEKKSPQNFSAIGVTDLRLFKKWCSTRKRYRKIERQREEIQSRRGSRPFGSHGGQGPERRTSPLSPPVALECRRGTIIATIVFINDAVFTNIFITFLTSFQQSTPPQPTVIPYLNMVLDDIDYYGDDFLHLLCV